MALVRPIVPLLVLVAAEAAAKPIWIDQGDVPLGDWIASAEIVRPDEPLYVSPGGPRRATIAAGVRLPILGAVRGPGCVSRWLLVGPVAYVCSDKVKLSADPPGVADTIHPQPADGLPFRYYFVGANGGDAYAKLADTDDETVAEQMEKGWGVSGIKEVVYNSKTYVLTRKGRYVPRAQLGAVGPYAFHGEEITSKLAIGWVMPDKANVIADAKPGAKVVGARTRLQVVAVLEHKGTGKDTFVRIAEGAWMRASDLRVPTLAPPPVEVAPSTRWIDIELAQQTLVAYVGEAPWFATVVSTGKAAGTTPKGVFPVWVKLRSSTMSNADDPQTTTDDGTPYSIEDVPWVQYFSKGVALHGAFWHRKFGFPHSHGCVNLAPLDAMKLFDWTLPRLPRGWDAVLPTQAEPATWVRVR